MEYAKYYLTEDQYIPAVVEIGNRKTPIWMQQLWADGEYQEFVRKNGCGHCCAAMALNLYGISITPHDEYSLCRELWGAPSTNGEYRQGNFQSLYGITKIIRHHGVKAEAFGVSDLEVAGNHIESALREGKIVIFESHPTPEFPDNPFSTGEHWVMAVGYTFNGQILIANSSVKAVTTGIQLVDIGTIKRALPLGASPDEKMTWGEWRETFMSGIGYIIVG